MWLLRPNLASCPVEPRVSQALPGDSLLVSDSPPEPVARTDRCRKLISIGFFIPRATRVFQLLLINCAVSLPIHLGGRMISASTRTSRSASRVATVVVAGFLKGAIALRTAASTPLMMKGRGYSLADSL
jgi:hypothetical protein